MADTKAVVAFATDVGAVRMAVGGVRPAYGPAAALTGPGRDAAGRSTLRVGGGAEAIDQGAAVARRPGMVNGPFALDTWGTADVGCGVRTGPSPDADQPVGEKMKAECR
ncbi:MAG: hypothetical protein IPO05_16275 [Flavobacteriales bacterium]|nr:hypothetical protein [Flavobacteriales bacterium]